MASGKIHVVRGILGLVFAAAVAILAVGCSSDDAGQADSEEQPASGDAGGADGEIVDNEGDGDSAESDQASADDSADDEPGDAAAALTLASEGHASVTELGAGEQVQDAHGNLIAIYGFTAWSEAFATLPDGARERFPFFGDVEAASDPDGALLILDIGMCSAGIDATGFGTADFFLHEAPDEVLSTDQVRNRSVLARHPVVQPGFRFPAPAECARGFLPVLWFGDDDPAVARYVLASRPSADAAVERHVYQWTIEGARIERDAFNASAAELEPTSLFGAGQTVTFNEGRLAGTSVVVNGWAERVGVASEIDGTRIVSVSLTFCPASPVLPELGLAVDGWNIAGPLPGGLLEAVAADDSSSCTEGWLDFAVPFGGVPTAFFASDGVNSVIGYAEWSLDGAALPVPQ